jgi:aminoglycoside phosphotransferase (APT) family kinase protein
VDLAGGEILDIFLKDFSRSKLPKHAAAEQRERELRVYEELLEGQDLGTARFYAARWDEAAQRFWLLLEFVNGELLRDCGFPHWRDAAAWLARLHGRFSDQLGRLQASDFLVRHDADFFLATAERARAAVSSVSDGLARRLALILERHAAMLPLLSRAPDMLVHGSYRPQNVLVVRASPRARICPTDWEHSAFGRSTYDLAWLCDGFRAPRLDILLDAYEQEAERFGLGVPDRAELRHEIDCYRLHKIVNSLGHVQQWPRPYETALKVIGAGEQLVRAVE